MKTAYICSPLSGNIKDNIRKAKLYGKYAFKRGMAPVIPHIYAESYVTTSLLSENLE